MSLFDSALDGIDIAKARSELNGQGWAILGSPLPTDVLGKIRGEIDTLAEAEGTEVNYGGSEHRVWKAHEKSSFMDEFRAFSDKILSQVEEAPFEAYDILAIRNRTLDPEAAALRKGRWHLDSMSRQLKIFVFLTDVTQASGPFEMIPGTHATSFKMKEALKGNLITPADIVNGSRAYSQLKEELIEKIVSKGYETKAFDVPAGTMALVDTSSVHRARPCTQGERYALTSYYH